MSSLSLKRYQSFHFSPNPKDIYKPNFIFSSDIPEIAQQLSAVYGSSRDADLGSQLNISFNVNIELNTLINRNRGLKPSELIRDNLIFLAKSDSKKSVNFLNGLVFQQPQYMPSIINNEVFIVTLTLSVEEFIAPDKLVFSRDENYMILHKCDASFLVYIENYILKTFEDVNKTVESPLNDISGTETTIEVSEYDIEHLSEYEHIHDYSINDTNDSLDLMFLKSDDDDTVTLVGKSKIGKPRQLNDDNFIYNITNLRHNEEHENENELESDSDDDSDFANKIHIDDILASPAKLKDPTFPATIKLRPSIQDLKPEPVEDNPIISRKTSRTFQVPTKIMKSPSFTIPADDLDYGGPAFIKGDTKFKYIKVGKVQKFVNLFEERVNEEAESRSGSRSGSRPVSRTGSRPVSRPISPIRRQSISPIRQSVP